MGFTMANKPIKMNKKCYRKGTLILEEIKFDHVFKRKVMRSGKVGKIYLPKELVDKTVVVVADLNQCNDV